MSQDDRGEELFRYVVSGLFAIVFATVGIFTSPEQISVDSTGGLAFFAILLSVVGGGVGMLAASYLQVLHHKSIWLLPGREKRLEAPLVSGFFERGFLLEERDERDSLHFSFLSCLYLSPLSVMADRDAIRELVVDVNINALRTTMIVRFVLNDEWAKRFGMFFRDNEMVSLASHVSPLLPEHLQDVFVRPVWGEDVPKDTAIDGLIGCSLEEVWSELLYLFRVSMEGDGFVFQQEEQALLVGRRTNDVGCWSLVDACRLHMEMFVEMTALFEELRSVSMDTFVKEHRDAFVNFHEVPYTLLLRLPEDVSLAARNLRIMAFYCTHIEDADTLAYELQSLFLFAHSSELTAFFAAVSEATRQRVLLPALCAHVSRGWWEEFATDELGRHYRWSQGFSRTQSEMLASSRRFGNWLRLIEKYGSPAMQHDVYHQLFTLDVTFPRSEQVRLCDELLSSAFRRWLLRHGQRENVELQLLSWLDGCASSLQAQVIRALLSRDVVNERVEDVIIDMLGQSKRCSEAISLVGQIGSQRLLKALYDAVQTWEKLMERGVIAKANAVLANAQESDGLGALSTWEGEDEGRLSVVEGDAGKVSLVDDDA